MPKYHTQSKIQQSTIGGGSEFPTDCILNTDYFFNFSVTQFNKLYSTQLHLCWDMPKFEDNFPIKTSSLLNFIGISTQANLS